MAKKSIPTIAIVGRTNVGKSTLFNSILGRRIAIVEDTPGVTRDRHYAVITRFAHPFSLVDTGGIIGDDDEAMQSIVRDQSQLAIDEADLIIAMFDGIAGVQPDDEAVTDVLRRSGKPVLWVINKTEKPMAETLAAEFYSLGLDSFICLSAAHQVGVSELIRQIEAFLVEHNLAVETPARAEKKPIYVAIVGRPNVGKSTLTNRIIGEDRQIVSELAGTTRDSIDIELTREGQQFVLTDTAGLRKKARVDDLTVERYSNLRSLRSLIRSDVAVLVLDATDGAPGEQDSKLAGLVHERGRGFVIVVNKWDAIEKDHRTVKAFEQTVKGVLKFAPYAPILYVSALTGKRCPGILEKVREVYETSHIRIQTSELNKAVKRAFDRRPPPVYRGEPIKFYFATQVDSAPPTFVLFVNHPRKINFSYERYIKNQIREDFPFEGSDIRIIWRKRENKEPRDGKGHVRA